MRRKLSVLLGVLILGGAAAVAYHFVVRPGGGTNRGGGGEGELAVRQFCTTCHKFPPPDSLPRPQWAARIKTMYEIARGDSRTPLENLPPPEAAVAFYTSRAPEELESIATTAGSGPGPLSVKRKPLKLRGLDPYPGVSNVQFVHLLDDERPELLICEMRFGLVLLLDPADPETRARVLGRARNPCRAQVVDLDSDGFRDVLVSVLGTVTPSDVLTGEVVWLRGDGRGNFQRFVLASGLGRVADARAADFDGDGDQDVVVAVFGWRKVGEILYLENRTTDPSTPRFEPLSVDPRPGAIHVPVTDLDGDGRPDFVALISQHFETVVAFLNRGSGFFEARTIFSADHPNWGSTGIELVDFEGDGDLDVLFTNGDSLDDLVVKPYHGIQWLENRGEYPFTYHRLTDLYGASAASAGDLDGDGDLDIVASVFLPFLRPDDPGAESVESIIWLEQFRPGRFRRHSLEAVSTFHPTLALGDFDGDGDLDIAVGNMTMARRGELPIEDSVLLLENQRR
ncbi:MAG: VCBS repeat-containing protein [Planctomycetota bacterium]|nr:VCBS repeat-containing protein [Planctomycetota bacterium]